MTPKQENIKVDADLKVAVQRKWGRGGRSLVSLANGLMAGCLRLTEDQMTATVVLFEAWRSDPEAFTASVGTQIPGEPCEGSEPGDWQVSPQESEAILRMLRRVAVTGGPTSAESEPSGAEKDPETKRPRQRKNR